MDDAPITPRAVLTELTNNNIVGLSSSNGKFKTSRGYQVGMNEKISTERMSSCFYVDDDDEERDESEINNEEKYE